MRRRHATSIANGGPFHVPAERSFRPDIQGLRALAVLLVIADHADIPGFSGGYIGVDLFFVVSGYVITQLLLREAGNGIGTGLGDFYARRVRRIVPAATATLVATLLVAWATLGARLNPQLPGDVRWASLFSANFRFIETGSNYFVPGIFPSLITQFWSLGVEEQFYLCFPLVVLLIARFAPAGRRLALLSVTLTVAIALSAWWSIHLSAIDPTPAYYSPFTRFWELGLGCLLATLTVRRPVRTARSEWLAVAIAIALLVVALTTLNRPASTRGPSPGSPVGLARCSSGPASVASEIPSHGCLRLALSVTSATSPIPSISPTMYGSSYLPSCRTIDQLAVARPRDHWHVCHRSAVLPSPGESNPPFAALGGRSTRRRPLALRLHRRLVDRQRHRRTPRPPQLTPLRRGRQEDQ